MKKVIYIIGAVFIFKMLAQRTQASNVTQTPADVLQGIRDQNASFWASVGAPFDLSNGQIVAPPDFSPGVSAIPYNDPSLNGT
jgi:hypothetical protein